jgi:hypothetical protein
MSFVIAGLDPAIHDGSPRINPHVFNRRSGSWIAGSSPAITPGALR